MAYSELSAARRDELVETWAQGIAARGLGAAAVFLLEAHKPLAGLGAQAVRAFQPLLANVLRLNIEELAAFMSDDENVERLARRIEEVQRERTEQEDAARRQTAAARARARRVRRPR